MGPTRMETRLDTACMPTTDPASSDSATSNDAFTRRPSADAMDHHQRARGAAVRLGRSLRRRPIDAAVELGRSGGADLNHQPRSPQLIDTALVKRQGVSWVIDSDAVLGAKVTKSIVGLIDSTLENCSRHR